MRSLAALLGALCALVNSLRSTAFVDRGARSAGAFDCFGLCSVAWGMGCRFAGVASLLGKLAWRLDCLRDRGARSAGGFLCCFRNGVVVNGLSLPGALRALVNSLRSTVFVDREARGQGFGLPFFVSLFGQNIARVFLSQESSGMGRKDVERGG